MSPASDHRRAPGFTAAATAAHMERAVERALDDPAKLARAARIVRAALARKRLTVEDISPAAGPATHVA